MPISEDGKKVTCASCAFMDATDPPRPFCRRYPAQLAVEGGNLRALYPVVTPDEDWCGEHSEYKPRLRGTEH